MSLLRRLVITFGLGLHLALVLVSPALAFVPPPSGVINGVRVVPGVARTVAPFLWRGLGFTPWGVAGAAAFCIVADGSDYACFRPSTGGDPWPVSTDGIAPTVDTLAVVAACRVVQQAWGTWQSAVVPCGSAAMQIAADRALAVARANFGPTVASMECTTNCSGTPNSGMSWFMTYDNGTTMANALQNVLGIVDAGTTCPTGYSATGQGGAAACTRSTCPAGSTLANGVCLGNFYPVNGVPTWASNGVNFAPDPRDPDSAGRTSTGTATATGVTPEGWPTRVRIEVMPDGGIRITQEVQHATGGNTQTAVTQVTIAPDGTVTSTTTSNAPGPLPSSPSSPSPNTGTPIPLELPTDYAREPTTASIRDNTKAMRDDAEKGAAQADAWKAPSLPSGYGDASQLGLPSADAFPVPAVAPSVSGSAACQPLSLGLWGMQADVCPWLAQWRPLIDWGWIAACGIATVTTLLRRTEV